MTLLNLNNNSLHTRYLFKVNVIPFYMVTKPITACTWIVGYITLFKKQKNKLVISRNC